MRLYMAARHKRQRAKAIDFLGGVCVDCGSTDQLEFDHVDPAAKEFTISSKFTRGWARLVDELAKCELRCAPCHRKRSAAQKSVEHGGGVTGKKNCRCQLCGPLKQKYMKDRYKPRRLRLMAGLQTLTLD